MRMTGVLALMTAASAAAAVGAQTRTTGDGVYSQAQMKRGEAVYTRSCASCHQPDLSGDGQTPALVGKDFNIDWVDQTLGDLFDRTKTSMPADKPGSLAAPDVADVIAFILSKGGFPAGQTELSPDMAALKVIKFVAPKP